MLVNNYQFAKLNQQNLSEVYALEQSAHGFPWTFGIIKDCLAKYNCFGIYPLNSKQIVGYSVMQIILDEAHLLNLTIAPNYQKRGLGRKLLEFTLQKAQENKATNCFLEVAVNNFAAINLYDQNGFNQIGLRSNYYRDKNGNFADAYVMALEFI